MIILIVTICWCVAVVINACVASFEIPPELHTGMIFCIAMYWLRTLPGRPDYQKIHRLERDLLDK